MKAIENDGKIVISLDGRIDTNNAPDIEKELTEITDSHEGLIPVIDAEDLIYISSAGLRVLMKLCKKYKTPLEVINVSRDVYEIFETTGFTELMNVKKAYRRVSIDGLQLIGKGVTGDVYRMDSETVIKVFRPNISFDLVISKENTKARNAFISGVPTAIPYDIVRVGECYGTVYEMLEAKDLVSVMAEDKEHLEDHVSSFAKIVKEMHGIEADPERFGSVKTDSLRALPYLASVLSDEETGKLREIYEYIPERSTFIHGDCHPGNVMVRDGEMMFIDLATAGTGHPVFDFVSMYSLFVERANDPKAIEASPILRHFAPDELKRIWRAFITTYLGTDDEDTIAKAGRQIDMISTARRLFMVIAMPGVLSPEAIAAMKKKLFAYYDAGLEPFCF